MRTKRKFIKTEKWSFFFMKIFKILGVQLILLSDFLSFSTPKSLRKKLVLLFFGTPVRAQFGFFLLESSPFLKCPACYVVHTIRTGSQEIDRASLCGVESTLHEWKVRKKDTDRLGRVAKLVRS